jgi:hypothetical protein
MATVDALFKVTRFKARTGIVYDEREAANAAVVAHGPSNCALDSGLRGFFFGATKNEYDLAQLLREKFRFAFVVLSEKNEQGQHFFELLTFEQVEQMTRTK